MRHAISLLRVGFDLDGVLSLTERACLAAFKAAGLVPETATSSDITAYDYEDCFPGVTREFVRAMFREGRVFRSAPVNPEALALLNCLTRMGVETHIVTHRPGDEIRRETAHWLAVHEAEYSHLVLVDDRMDKVDYCRAKGIDIFIEDNLDTALALSGAIRLSLLYDKLYNRGHIQPPHFARFYCWDEVKRIFTE